MVKKRIAPKYRKFNGNKYTLISLGYRYKKSANREADRLRKTNRSIRVLKYDNWYYLYSYFKGF